MLASLPMYDLPELRPSTDVLWRAIASELRARGVADVPEALTRSGRLEEDWAAPDLLLSQTCGYPLTHAFAGRLLVVAVPCYRAEGCQGAWYRSHCIVSSTAAATRLEDLRGGVGALNSRTSHSGMNALRALLAPLARVDPRGPRGNEAASFFDAVKPSGSHLASLAMVASGDADLASIDCVTHALVTRVRPAALLGTRVLTSTAPAPALPFVTSATASAELVAHLRAALSAVMVDPALATAREAMLLDGFEFPEDGDDGQAFYAPILEMEREAVRAGYPEIV